MDLAHLPRQLTTLLRERRLRQSQGKADADWQKISSAKVDALLRRASALDDDGFYPVLPSAEVKPGAVRAATIDGIHYVLWRQLSAPWKLLAGPAACPHMGADLSDGGWVDGEGRLRCPWHGLALTEGTHPTWTPLPTFDDGTLLWLQPRPRPSGPQLVTIGRETPGSSERSDNAPSNTTAYVPKVLSYRPSPHVASVVYRDAHCDPEDIIANRLDPWHGAHFHPHTFTDLEVVSEKAGVLTVKVAFRLLPGVKVPVVAQFFCCGPRTILMRIVSGEGQGSLVETHAVPLGPGRTRVIEATFATSDRPGFHCLRPWMQHALAPLFTKRAERLWQEDCAYAERRYVLRQSGSIELSKHA